MNCMSWNNTIITYYQTLLIFCQRHSHDYICREVWHKCIAIMIHVHIWIFKKQHFLIYKFLITLYYFDLVLSWVVALCYVWFFVFFVPVISSFLNPHQFHMAKHYTNIWLLLLICCRFACKEIELGWTDANLVSFCLN